MEPLAQGFQDGLTWAVDHDDVAGTIGVTLVGTPRVAGKLMLNAQLVRRSNDQLIDTIAPVEIDQDAGRGRQVLYTNAALVGVSLLSNGTYALNIWTSFQPG